MRSFKEDFVSSRLVSGKSIGVGIATARVVVGTGTWLSSPLSFNYVSRRYSGKGKDVVNALTKAGKGATTAATASNPQSISKTSASKGPQVSETPAQAVSQTH